jgi:hypothetical protein
MTHTLHRCGTPESLRDDYPWLMYWSRGINDVDVRRKCLEIIEAAQAVGCENWGDTKAGSILARPAEEIKRDLTDRSRVRGVFTSKQQVTEFLRILKEKDLGMSVIISGLLEDVLDACRQAGVTPHTINFSLGVWGKKELLPPEEVLKITTMCGHHMISNALVEKLVSDIRRGKTTPRRAALRCARLCPCGVFNHIRAERLFAQMAGKVPPGAEHITGR